MKELPEVFGRNLRERMAASGMDADDLAQAVGVSGQSVLDYRAGRSVPQLANAVGIADALGCRLDELCREER